MPASSRRKKKETESNDDSRKKKRIDSILARLTRGGGGVGGRGTGSRRRQRPTDDELTTSSPISPPPDEVSSALGRSLASAYAHAYFGASSSTSTGTDSHDEAEFAVEAEEVGGAIVDVLSSRSCISGSTSRSFFDSLASASAMVVESSSSSQSSASTRPSRRDGNDIAGLLDLWSRWLILLEERIDLASTLRGGGWGDDVDMDNTPDPAAASEALSACITGFVRVALCLSRLELEADGGSAVDDGGGGGRTSGGRSSLATAYGRMSSAQFRRLLLSEAASAAVGCGCDDRGGGMGAVADHGGVGGGAVASRLLTPLLVRCLLHPTVAIDEKRHCVTCVVRECRLPVRLLTSTMPVAKDDAATAARCVVGDMVLSLTGLLVLYIKMNALSTGQTRGEAEELALDWCTDLTELVLGLVTTTNTPKADDVDLFDGVGFVERVVSDVLPSLVASPLAIGCSRRPLRPLLLLMRDVVDRCQRRGQSGRAVGGAGKEAHARRHEMAVFRLCLSALNSPVESDVSAMLSLLHSLVVDEHEVVCMSFDRTSCEAVGTVLSASSGPECSSGARRLLLQVDRPRSGHPVEQLTNASGKEVPSSTAAVPLLFRPSSCPEGTANASTLAEMLDSILPSGHGDGDNDDDDEDLPTFVAPATQAALIHMVSSCLLCRDAATIVRDAALRLTERISSNLPHLSVRLYPVLLRLLRGATLYSNNDSSEEHGEDVDADTDVSDDDVDRAELAVRILRLLAGPMSSTNPHVATQVFNFLAKWITDPHAPTPLRSTSIRILPLLCKTNRRTFRRVSDLLKSEFLLRSKIPEIGVSTAASISDLCGYQPDGSAEELLGVLQGVLLVDDDPLIVSFGIISLHNLVESGRLDFDVTIKVLRKRMKFDVTDVDEILGQDEEVIKSLVVLFGDGAIEDDGSGSSDDDDNGDGGGGVTQATRSPQVASAIRVLWGVLSLATSTSTATAGLVADAPDSSTASPLMPAVPPSVRVRVYHSLAGYDVATLGIDGEVIRSSVGSVGGGGGDGEGGASTGDDDGYSKAVALLLDCLRFEETNLSPSSTPSSRDDDDNEDDEDEDQDRPLPQLERLIRNVAGAEYDALGSTLWTKPESRNAAVATASSSAVRGGGVGMTSVPSPSKAAMSALPTEEQIRSIYEDDPSSASATSLLFAFRIPSPPTIESIDDAMTSISDLSCDMRNDDYCLGLKSDRPLIGMVTLSAWVHAMRKVWWAALSLSVDDECGEDGDNFDSVADRIVGRFDDVAASTNDDYSVGGGADNAHIAMAASALVLSERRASGGAGYDGGSKVPTIISSLRDRITSAVQGRVFDSDGVANLCTALVALSSVHAQDAGGLEDAVKMLLCSLDDEDGHGGTDSFLGAVLGLGLVAEGLIRGASMASAGAGGDRTTSTTQILRKVTSRLVEELTGCLSVRHDSVVCGLGTMIFTGRPTPDLVTHLTSLPPDDIHVRPDAKERFRTCCAGVGFAVPALALLHMNFVSALYRLLVTVRWGYGKGYYVLPSAFLTCVDAGLLSREEQDSFFAQLFEESNASLSDFNETSDDATIALASLAHRMQEELGTGRGSSPPASRCGEILARLQGYVSAGTDEGAAVASMALCSAIGIVPAIASALDKGREATTTFASPPRLWPGSTKADVKSTILVLNEVFSQKNQRLFDGRSIAGATLALGMLSCMKSPPAVGGGGAGGPLRDDLSARSSSSDSAKVARSNRLKGGRRVDFRSFPRAREGTLTRHIVEWMEGCYHRRPDDASLMPTLLRCIGGGVVSLPGQFSRLFYSLLSDGGQSSWSREVRYECLRSISSQVECSHGDNVRDFVNIMVDISKLAPDSFGSLLDVAGLQTAYLQSLRFCLSRFPSGYVEGGIRNLWDGCCRILLNGGGIVAAETIMMVLGDVVKSSGGRRIEKAKMTRGAAAELLSPIAVTSIQKTIVTEIFPSLAEMIQAPGMQGVPVEGVTENFDFNFTDACKLWDAFFRCLDVVPLVRLEEAGFFLFGEECTDLRSLSSTFCRAFGTMHLVGAGAFHSIPDRMQLEVAKVRTWLSRQHLIDNCSSPSSSSVEGLAEAQIHSMRLLALEVARAADAAPKSVTVRRDAILRSFEIKQVTDGFSPMCVEQIAFDASRWCQDISRTSVPGLQQARGRSEVESSYSSLSVVCRGAAAFTGVPRIRSAASVELASICLSDLPLNLGTVCRDLSMSETISRQALQQMAKSDVGASGVGGPPRKERYHYLDDSSCAQTVFYCSSEKGHGFEPLASFATTLIHEAAFMW